jgi:hypothetical protein
MALGTLSIRMSAPSLESTQMVKSGLDSGCVAPNTQEECNAMSQRTTRA